MSKLLVLGGIVLSLLLWHSLWLHAIAFAFGYAGLMELGRAIKRNETARRIDLTRKSREGLRRQHGKRF